LVAVVVVAVAAVAAVAVAVLVVVAVVEPTNLPHTVSGHCAGARWLFIFQLGRWNEDIF
jgi:hypothetical protein